MNKKYVFTLMIAMFLLALVLTIPVRAAVTLLFILPIKPAPSCILYFMHLFEIGLHKLAARHDRDAFGPQGNQ